MNVPCSILLLKMRRMLGMPAKKDARRLTHHNAYHVAKIAALLGSLFICLGLVLWFALKANPKLWAVGITITAAGFVIFLVGAFFFFKSIYTTIRAQNKDEQDRMEAQQGVPTVDGGDTGGNPHT